MPALYFLLGIVLGYSLARALWKRKADRWFTLAMEYEGESLRAMYDARAPREVRDE